MPSPFFAWGLQQPDALLSRAWDGQWLLWHRHSGDTFLLTGLAAALFSHLRQGRASTAELLHSLPAQGQVPAPDAAGLEATLQEMMRQGLVTAHPL
jgi:PqqD family protein of HPr-rel-A system